MFRLESRDTTRLEPFFVHDSHGKAATPQECITRFHHVFFLYAFALILNTPNPLKTNIAPMHGLSQTRDIEYQGVGGV